MQFTFKREPFASAVFLVAPMLLGLVIAFLVTLFQW
jgi:hypothetical protein